MTPDATEVSALFDSKQAGGKRPPEWLGGNFAVRNSRDARRYKHREEKCAGNPLTYQTPSPYK